MIVCRPDQDVAVWWVRRVHEGDENGPAWDHAGRKCTPNAGRFPDSDKLASIPGGVRFHVAGDVSPTRQLVSTPVTDDMYACVNQIGIRGVGEEQMGTYASGMQGA